MDYHARTGQELWNWILGSNPIPGMLVADLSKRQHADIVTVLDGMVRERSETNGQTVLTAPAEYRGRPQALSGRR